MAKKTALAAYHSLVCILWKQNGLSTETKSLLYKQLIRACMTYSFPIWHAISPPVMRELEMTERKVLRTCTGLHRRPGGRYYRNEALYNVSNTPQLRDFMFESLVKQMATISTHTNPIVAQIPHAFDREILRYLSPLLGIEEAHRDIYFDTHD